MLDLLARLLGPQRAVSVYVFLRRFGIPIVLLAAFALLWAVFLILSDPNRHRHIAYHTVVVLQTAPLTGTANSGLFVDVALPDGTALKLNTTEAPMIASLSDTACIEEREDTRTGEISFRLRLPASCARAAADG